MRARLATAFATIIGMRVDAGTDGGTPKSELAEQFRLLLDASIAHAYGSGVGGEFLAEAHGDGVHHVGTAGFQDVVKLFALGFERSDETVERGVKAFQFEQRRQAHSGGEDVVGGLSIVDVVVGVRVLVLAQLATQQLGGAVGNDLVGVHVEADTRACLKDIHHEVLVPLAFLNFLRRLDDGGGGLRIHKPEFAIGFGGGLFHHGNGANERDVCAESADGKVLDGTGRLDTVVGIGRNVFEAERVFFGTGGHECASSKEMIAEGVAVHGA